MNGTTLAAVCKLKNGQNNYPRQPAYMAGQPETLLGTPVIEAVDMPDAAWGAFRLPSAPRPMRSGFTIKPTASA